MFNKIIYLHGFNSSPESYKAKAILDYMIKSGNENCLSIPRLSPYPETVIEEVSLLVENELSIDNEMKLSFIGSSLGGYYATWFAEKYNCPTVLINPSVRPYETLAEYIGENENYHTAEKWCLDHNHIQQLSDIDVKNITNPEQYLVLLQTGDEVLDYRQAEKKYAKCNLITEQGGDHSFIGFENHIDKIVAFLKQ